jgi:hypothetical protein
MQYNETLGEWTASYPIPSILTTPFYYGNDPAALAGFWTLFISGESPAAENAAAQYSYTNVLPYTLLRYYELNSSTVNGASLVTSNGTGYALTDAAALHLTVSGLTLNLGQDSIGNLTVVNSRVFISSSELSSLKALNSTVALLDDTRVGSLSLTGSAVTISDSAYQAISPALPTISVAGLSQPIRGLANFSVTVTGEQLAADSLAATIDGVNVPLIVTPASGGLTATATVNATAMSDGVHLLSVTAPQTDSLSTSFSSSFSTDAQSTALKNQIGSLGSQQKNTSAEVGELTKAAYVLAVVVVASLAVAIYAVRRKPGATQTGAG